MENAFVRSPQDVLKHFNVTEQSGYSSSAVEGARKKYGKNGMHNDIIHQRREQH